MTTSSSSPMPRTGHGARALRRVAVLLAAAGALAALPVQAQPMHAHAGHGMHQGAGLHGPAGLSGRMLDAVGASAEQKAQVRKILDGAREELRSQHQAQRALHQQMLALLAAPQVDAAAAEALRQKQLAGHDAASKRMLQAMLDAAAVLSPEQRQKLAEQLQQRRQRMERHHGAARG